MRWVLAVVLLFAACGEQERSRPGDPGVYQRIDSSTDCNALNAEYEAADRNLGTAQTEQQEAWSRSYRREAHERMKAIGCYSG